MDKGLWAWRISVGAIALIIVLGVATVAREGITGENLCPIFYDDKTDWVMCYTVNWQSHCEDLGCEKISFSCGRPACDCRSV